jgi:hypothetical protein
MEKKENYQISKSMNEGVLEIAVTGKVTEHHIPGLQEEFNSHRAAGCYKLLIDIRSIDGSVNESALYQIKRPRRTIGKTAIVDRPEHEQYKPFWEKLTSYSPMELKWFSDIEAARDWLKRTDKSRARFVNRLFGDAAACNSGSNTQL